MPLFSIDYKKTLAPVEQQNFPTERDLQRLIEANLQAVFECRLVASEFPTGIQHGGRIDTLALSEDGNPVIIEYKKVASSELVTQSPYYLAWMRDHKGDFEIAARKQRPVPFRDPGPQVQERRRRAAGETAQGRAQAPRPTQSRAEPGLQRKA